MTTYGILKLLIENNRYTYDDMYRKLDLFLSLNRINEPEYVELTGLLKQIEHIQEPIEEEYIAEEPEEEL